jgi:demethylmenaquinone methyltransferase / 2-methoxy-6-polyprenyl-1,4-benzoquinol methylase
VTPRPPHPTDPSYVRDLFTRNARTYDSLNGPTSFWQVDRWRHELVALARIPAAGRVLDAFAGPGSLSLPAVRRLGPQGKLVLADLSPVMLANARTRLAGEQGTLGTRPLVSFVAADLLDPATDIGRFDVVLLGFGLRYVREIVPALRRLTDLLAPGGRLAVLEFTRPPRALSWGLPAQMFFRYALPHVGRWLGGDPELYAYLRDSAGAFLTPAGLGAALWEAGLVPGPSRIFLGGLVTDVVAERLPRDYPSSASRG